MLGVVVGEYGSEMVGGGGGGSGVSRGEGGVGGSVGHVRGLGGTIGRPVRHAVRPVWYARSLVRHGEVGVCIDWHVSLCRLILVELSHWW